MTLDLDYGAFESRAAAYKDAVRKDVALKLGVSPSSVVIHSVTKGSVVFEFSVNGVRNAALPIRALPNVNAVAGKTVSVVKVEPLDGPAATEKPGATKKAAAMKKPESSSTAGIIAVCAVVCSVCALVAKDVLSPSATLSVGPVHASIR